MWMSDRFMNMYVNMRSTCRMKWADNNLSINPFKYQDTFKIGSNLRPCQLMSNINLIQISCLGSVKYFNIYNSGCVKVQNILRFIVLEKEIIEKLAALYVMFYYPPLLDVIYSFVWLHHTQIVAQKCHWTVKKQKRVEFSCVLVSDITMLFHVLWPVSRTIIRCIWVGAMFSFLIGRCWPLIGCHNVWLASVPCNPCIF